MKNHLELFSGTHSFGKVSSKKEYNVISLDRDLGSGCPFSDYESKTHIKKDIMLWDYKVFPKDYFDLITASPVCMWWSNLRNSWIGRKLKSHGDNIITKEILEEDINKYGKPMVDKVIEIIEYFKPKNYIIENPFTGTMKKYIESNYPKYHKNKKIVDYCSYDDNINYQKRTIFWTTSNIKCKLCKKEKCPNMENGRHKINMGNSQYIIDNGKKIFIITKALREKYKDYEKFKQDGKHTKYHRYRIPKKLVEDLIDNLIQ